MSGKHTESSNDAAKDSLDTDNAIRERAYKLWQLEGSPLGRLEQYWNRAKELIEDEAQSSYPPAASRGNRT